MVLGQALVISHKLVIQIPGAMSDLFFNIINVQYLDVKLAASNAINNFLIVFCCYGCALDAATKSINSLFSSTVDMVAHLRFAKEN